jgi:hypothetical protein
LLQSPITKTIDSAPHGLEGLAKHCVAFTVKCFEHKVRDTKPDLPDEMMEKLVAKVREHHYPVFVMITISIVTIATIIILLQLH